MTAERFTKVYILPGGSVLLERSCAYCGTVFTTPNDRRLFCSGRCRRDADNERKRERRAAAREEREGWLNAPFGDPWERNDAELAGALLDGWSDAGPCLPCGLLTCEHEALAGPLACQQCDILRGQSSPCAGCVWHQLEADTVGRRNFGPARRRRFDAGLVCLWCAVTREN